MHKVFGTRRRQEQSARRASTQTRAIRELSDEKDLPVQNLLATWAENGADEPFEIDIVPQSNPEGSARVFVQTNAFLLPSGTVRPSRTWSSIRATRG